MNELLFDARRKWNAMPPDVKRVVYLALAVAALCDALVLQLALS